MEYCALPRGGPEERFRVLGLGLGGIQVSPPDEIEAVVRTALDSGVNFFDLCGGGASVYKPFGRAVAGRREQVFFQLHFGAVYNEKGEYGWSRDLRRIQEGAADYKRTVLQGGKASACIACGQFESACPQQLKVIGHLQDCAAAFKC